MKKTKKTAKKTVAKKVLGGPSQQPEKKAPIKSSQQTEDKTPIKSSGLTGQEVPITPLQKIEKKASLKSKPKIDGKEIKKQYLKSKTLCKVTFRLPKEAAPSARIVSVVGDFNNWNVKRSPMKKMSNGDFTLTLPLPCSGEYHFRYLVDAERWENDWFADKYIPNEYGEDNSVVVV